MERVELGFVSHGGRCAATLYRPDAATEPLPCVVMAPGGTLTRRDGMPGYAERFAAAGLAALAFDYRHWGGSDGEPRRWLSIRRQLEDCRAAVVFARTLEDVDQDRVALWGMSLAGGHVLVTAADDPRIAAVVALVPLADGLAFNLRPAPVGVAVRGLWRAVREVVTRRPVTVPVAGPPGSLAVNTAPEALPGFQRVTTGGDWRNEVNTSTAFAMFRYRPVQRAAEIRAPVLVQLGEHDEMAPRTPIERTAARAPRAELLRYPMGHFGGFWPEHLDRVAGDEVDFLRRHLGRREEAT